MYNDMFQQMNNITFSELYDNVEKFKSDYKLSGVPLTYTVEGNTIDYLSEETLSTIYVLLLGRFADSTIKAFNVEGAFKIRLMSRIWQHAPAWQKNLDIQNKLRSMSLDEGSDIYKGAKAIYNSALNPGTMPGTDTLEELTYINSQNTTNYKKSKLDGLTMLADLIRNDITETFLRRFDDLFLNIIYTGTPLLYETEV